MLLGWNLLIWSWISNTKPNFLLFLCKGLDLGLDTDTLGVHIMSGFHFQNSGFIYFKLLVLTKIKEQINVCESVYFKELTFPMPA